jgi:hypothetical protein
LESKIAVELAALTVTAFVSTRAKVAEIDSRPANIGKKYSFMLLSPSKAFRAGILLARCRSLRTQN